MYALNDPRSVTINNCFFITFLPRRLLGHTRLLSGEKLTPGAKLVTRLFAGTTAAGHGAHPTPVRGLQSAGVAMVRRSLRDKIPKAVQRFNRAPIAKPVAREWPSRLEFAHEPAGASERFYVVLGAIASGG